MQRNIFLLQLLVFSVYFVIGCAQSTKDEPLFTVDLKYQQDFDKGTLPENIRQTFTQQGHTLSHNATIEAIKQAFVWSIRDRDQKREYSVIKEEESISVYPEKINFEEIKENRQGLDYRKQEISSLFYEFDLRLKRWIAAQFQEQYGVSSALKGEIQEMVRGYFSQVVDALKSNNAFEQTVAAAVLGFSNDVRAIPHLLELLLSPNASLRTNAALGIGQIEFSQMPAEVSTKVSREILKALQNENDEDARAMMTFALSQMITPQTQDVLPYLLEFIRDKSPKVRNHVVIALGKTQHIEAIKAIIASGLEDEHPAVRYSSIRALNEIDNREIDMREPLIKKMYDPSPVVAGAAYHVLKNKTGKDFGPQPQKWEEWAGLDKTTVDKPN